MNANTVAGFRPNQLPLQALATTTETALVANTDTGTTAAFLVVPSGGIVGSSSPLDPNANPAILNGGGRDYGRVNGSNRPYFSTSSFDGRPFKVRISGTGNAGANAGQTVLVNLYQGTSTTLASNKLLGTTGAALATAAGGAFNFNIELNLLWDATSGILSGSQSAVISFGTGAQYTVPKAVANVVTGVTAATLSFLPSVQFGNAAASSIQIKDYSIEQV